VQGSQRPWLLDVRRQVHCSVCSALVVSHVPFSVSAAATVRQLLDANLANQEAAVTLVFLAKDIVHGVMASLISLKDIDAWPEHGSIASVHMKSIDEFLAHPCQGFRAFGCTERRHSFSHHAGSAIFIPFVLCKVQKVR